MAIFGALAPILIPAAIGAFTSAAMGRNPLQGAVMGGITGGLLGPAGGNLFNLGSSTAATAGTGAATSAGTAFGASQAPSSLLASGVGSGATTGAISSGAAPLYNGPVSSTVGGIHTGAGVPSDVALSNLGNKSMMQATNLGRPADYIAPLPENTVQFDAGLANTPVAQKYPDYSITQDKLGKSLDYTGGGAEIAEKPLYEKAYESVINYAQKNPLEVGGLALVASGGIKPRTPQVSSPSVGSITKGTPPQQAGQILQVKRPTRFA